MDKYNVDVHDEFFEAILKLRTIDDCRAFFDDVCTIKELQDLSQRLKVAGLLRLKKSYLEIANETGASTATISRVSRCLNYGSGGYSLVLGDAEGENDGN